MTGSSTPESARAPGAPSGGDRGPSAGDDQTPVPIRYGHGRMPLFMKLLWTAFLVFITYYVAVYLIPAAGDELAG